MTTPIELDPRLELIWGRRSIRRYDSRPVADETIGQLLAAGMAAPSAVCRDPWRFVVVRDAPQRAAIAQGLPYGGMLAEAPVGIVVCGELAAAHDQQLSYLLQDCSAAIENILLAAHALGLGACWLGVHPRQERIEHIRPLLGIPDDILVISVLALGYPAETKEVRSRYNPDLIHQERW